MKYTIIALVATLGFISTTGTLYAQENETPTIAAVEVAEATAAQPDATAPSEAPASETKSIAISEKAPIDTAGEVLSDIRSGDWRHAMAGILVLLMLGLAKARDKIAWFEGDRGGAALVLFLGIGGSIITTLYASGPLDWRILLSGIAMSTSAAGTYTLVKSIIWPRDKAEE